MVSYLLFRERYIVLAIEGCLKEIRIVVGLNIVQVQLCVPNKIMLLIMSVLH